MGHHLPIRGSSELGVSEWDVEGFHLIAADRSDAGMVLEIESCDPVVGPGARPVARPTGTGWPNAASGSAPGRHRNAGPVPRGARTPSMTSPATPPASQTPLEPRIPDHPHARPRAPLAHECAFFLQLRDHALSASLRTAEILSELGNRRARILTEEPEGTGPGNAAFTRGLSKREYRLVDRLEHELNESLTRPARAFCTSRMSRGSPSTRCPSRTALTARSSRLFPSIMSEEQLVWILSSRRSAGFVARGACGESMPTSSAISMQSASIALVRSNGGS